VINGTKVLSTSRYFTDIGVSRAVNSQQTATSSSPSFSLSWIESSYQAILPSSSPPPSPSSPSSVYIDIDSEVDEERTGVIPPYY